MKSYLFKLLFFLLLSSFLIPLVASGQITIDNPLTANTFDELIGFIVNFVFNIAIILAPLMIIIAGFYFVTAAGDPGKIQTAKKIIFWTLFGVLITLLATGLISMLKQVLGPVL